MAKRPTAGIIGAGIAGIAASIRLANKGYDVHVFEANAYPGGKLTEIRQGGYRFDAGPSLFTLPEFVDELFTLSGRNAADHFQYIQLPVSCHYFYEDGTKLKAYADRKKFAEEIYQKTGEAKGKIDKALKNSQRLYDLLSDLFMKKSLHRWQTFTNPQALKAYTQLHRLDFFRSMNEANESFFSDFRLVQLFNRYATYNGSDPYQTPATLNIIPHLEFNIGAYFPVEGMHSITISLFELAKSLGVNFHFNAKAEKIHLDGNKANGLTVNSEKMPFDLLVSNMDIVNTYRKLLHDQPQPKRLLNQPKSSSALIFYWGIARHFEELDLHNIFFSQNYQQEFEYIFKKGGVSEDPTVYINITSKYRKDDAPEGCENWFTMINVPNNSGQDWDQIIQQSRENIVKKLSRMLNRDVAALIQCESILDPRLIEARTSSSMGALYGNSSNNKYAAFLRHANFSRKYKNLFFCGGSVHPGGGIPLSLLSAKIATEQIPDI
ncbi:phytoene desaturase [Catalinimonas alkaloidigena]|uniref:1-hydroxycarotenoid 3,4-desaturase CrtD n=1 Tax=Catalinimonas alkaloidigena TaxID=1075417 RepID=UPI00240747C1|nr:1-hydroxycarotenoid 3,4-desaturase CrtD [Catalinimonas alkaloidigena]MDF9800616.1 phytoene desaturase [Catalinimonas alkaloidigena]